MTHVCRSWRNVLLSTPGLWTQLDFSSSTKSQLDAFLHRSGNQLLQIYHCLDYYVDNAEPFLSVTLRNLFRLQGLWLTSTSHHLDLLLMNFLAAAPELKHLEIVHNMTEIQFPKIFGGQMPKLTSLNLLGTQTNLHDFNFPSLVRFSFTTKREISVQDLTSFFERCPLLEFVEINLLFTPQQPSTTPPCRRVCLAALQELRLDRGACITGLLDHLTLPACTMMRLEGDFTSAAHDSNGFHAARIHASSIDHLPVTKGITKAVTMPKSCAFSGPNGDLRFQCYKARENFDADFFTSSSPISVSQIRELWFGQKKKSEFVIIPHNPWNPSTAGVFTVLSQVEDLNIVSCETKPIFTTLGTTVDGGILLPRLRTLTVYVGNGVLDPLTLIQCAKTRKEHSMLLEEVTVVWDYYMDLSAMEEVEFLREFVGELTQRTESWLGVRYDTW